ncbi:MAG TPA: creatininase family protein [Gaiellaceae bacterium]|nr:creatininase family protein [Gaiellaceae bacterium]
MAYPDLEGRGGAVHLLPLGATEPHGPHAPLATDTIISEGISRRAADRLQGELDVLVLPAVPFGVTRYGADFPGAVSISEETLRSLVTEIAASFERVVLVNSHLEPEQVWTLRGLGLPLLDITRRASAQRLTDEFQAGAGHAGRYETSLVLADRPELVDQERMRTLQAKMIDMPAAIRSGQKSFLAMGMDEAYAGAPGDATAEEGEQTFEALVDMLVELIREVAGR